MKKNFTLCLFSLAVIFSTLNTDSLSAFPVSIGGIRCEKIADHPAGIADTGSYQIKLIPAAEGTFGYEIYSDKKLLVKQVNIPGLSGMKGFKRKADAQKVAGLVVDKLSKGIMPPTVDKSEMEKLKIMF